MSFTLFFHTPPPLHLSFYKKKDLVFFLQTTAATCVLKYTPKRPMVFVCDMESLVRTAKWILVIFYFLCWNWNTGREYYRNFPTVMGFRHLFHLKAATNSIKLYQKYCGKSILTVQTALAHLYMIHTLTISWSQYVWNKHSVTNISLLYWYNIDILMILPP